MISIVMLVIMAGCAALLFLKGTLVQGVTMILNALIGGFVAFGFFETLARLLVKYSPGVAVWAPLICFMLLFVLVFALLQAVTMQILKEKSDLGKLPEQIGRVATGVVLGYVVTGHLLVAAAMAPLPGQWPYPRFDERNPNPAQPNKAMLSPDGFVTGLFATISKGGFSAIGEPKSFAVLHAGFVDQLYLNRRGVSAQVPLMTSVPAVSVPQGGVRIAPDSLRDAEGKAISIPSGEDLMLVRVQLNARALKDAGKFTLSQVRLVCGARGSGEAPLAGEGQAVYPIGYVGDKMRLERKSLDEVITVASGSNEAPSMDLAFSVPSSLRPLLLEFKRNDVTQVPAPASREEALQPVPFGESQASPEPQGSGSEPTASAPSNGRNGNSRNGRDRTRERVENFTGPLGDE